MKNIVTSGRRKRSVARAILSEGKGIIRMNNTHIEVFGPELARMKILEPILLAGESAKNVDITITTHGVGFMTQADAGRLAVARALVAHAPRLKQVYLEYDRQLLVADIRVKEAAKPNHHGKARAGTQTSYR